MVQRIDALKAELLEKVEEVADKRLDANKALIAKAFIHHYYRNVSFHDMTDRDPEDLYGAAVSIWTFGNQRDADLPKIRVYNPRFEQHGWHSTHTVIEIINDNMPFLVDSVTTELARRNLTVHLVVHPVFMVDRDGEGKSIDFPAPELPANYKPNESYMHVEVDEQSDKQVLEAIEEALHKTLVDVRACVEDWSVMREKAVTLADELSNTPPKGVRSDVVEEVVSFLKWIHDDHYTFLGFREIDYVGDGIEAKLEIREQAGLGVLRDPDRQVFDGLRNLGDLPQQVQLAVKRPDLIRILKSNRRSNVHRRVHMDTISVKKFDDKGHPIGEYLFVGLLTSAAYNQSPSEIPLLRLKVASVLANSGYELNGHSGKALQHVLESYPRDELFQISTLRLEEIAHGIVNLQERQRVALFLRKDPFQRYISALVYVPKDRFSTTLRQRLGNILAKSFNGEIAANYTHMSEDALSRVQFIVKTKPGLVPDVDVADLEARMREAARTWGDRLRQSLVESFGEDGGLKIFRRFGDAFSLSYQDQFNIHTAAFDIQRIDEAVSEDSLAVNLYQPIEAEPHELRFKIYHPGGSVVLSDVMPMLENMGLKVMEEMPFDVRPADSDKPIFIHDFALLTADRSAVNIEDVRDVFHDSFKRVWNGEVENDGFNRLVLLSGLEWRDVVVLRAYSKYLRQMGIPFSQSYMEETLARNSGLAGNVAKLFNIRFDPTYDGDRDIESAKLVAEIHGELDQVTNLDEDRILRRFVNLVQCTLRTNFFQKDADGRNKSYISFKFAARDLLEVPQPAPLREIFVYSPRFEAVHLRFGLVARGGLRWSDRREDFRTEILGLVKAQQVKNAVIVPVGSKGGFVLKKAPPMSDREAFMKEGITCYQLFISGMLDITDNLQGHDIIAPVDVVRHDADDPYLVVAADKGTATFSDFANEMAIKYGFWLGDAFASGGSAGYDHKKMGITARGAWESVKRHFREMGRDTQSEDFTVVGVGDMSGDVFGNGMLLSEHIRLIGAFNHLHIFIDPNPNASKSFVERQRMFELPRSTWADYDASLISKGGGIFDRSAKSITLTPEIKELLSIKEDSLAPNDLIKALLKMQVDLLWFGGIGTYVKHSAENHADAGDRANDPLRVDARDLQCKVIGEGANLGVTHRARIEFAQNGGCVNTDAIDNSAGVDCSDHEVNIKILLGGVVGNGDMTEKQRNQLLEEMTDEVSALVLRDNYQQTQSVSVSEYRAASYLDRHQRVIRSMERAGELNRALEFLPDDEEIGERIQAKKGLSRPELSVILAYSKNLTYQDLLASDLPDDPVLAEDLFRYFPQPLQDRFPDYIENHRLRREIIATAVTNSMINRTGPAFMNEMRDRTGADASAIARAYTIVREVFDLRSLWKQIEALDNVASAETQIAMLQETGRTINRMTEWFLRNEDHPLDIASNITKYKNGVSALKENLEVILGDLALSNVHDRTKRFYQNGVPQDLAIACGQLKVLSSACDVVRLASIADQPVKEVGNTYTRIGTRFGLDWLRSAANRIPSDNQWHRMALGAIIDDLWGLQYELTLKVLTDGKSGEEAIDHWAASKQNTVERVDMLVGELNSLPQLDLAMLAVVSRELRGLTAG